MNINDISLDKAFYYVQMALSKQGLNPDQAYFDKVEMFANEIVYRLKYELTKQSNIKVINKTFKQKIKQPLTIKSSRPTSTWQMFKEQYAPKWFIERYPVKYGISYTNDVREIEINCDIEVGVDLIYPNVVIPKDNYTANFRFMNGQNFTIKNDTYEI